MKYANVNQTSCVVLFWTNRYTKAFKNNNCYNYPINFKFLSRFLRPVIEWINNLFLYEFLLVYFIQHFKIKSYYWGVFEEFIFKYKNVLDWFKSVRSLNTSKISLHICQFYNSWLTKMLASPFKKQSTM